MHRMFGSCLGWKVSWPLFAALSWKPAKYTSHASYNSHTCTVLGNIMYAQLHTKLTTLYTTAGLFGGELSAYCPMSKKLLIFCSNVYLEFWAKNLQRGVIQNYLLLLVDQLPTYGQFVISRFWAYRMFYCWNKNKSCVILNFYLSCSTQVQLLILASTV